MSKVYNIKLNRYRNYDKYVQYCKRVQAKISDFYSRGSSALNKQTNASGKLIKKIKVLVQGQPLDKKNVGQKLTYLTPVGHEHT